MKRASQAAHYTPFWQDSGANIFKGTVTNVHYVYV